VAPASGGLLNGGASAITTAGAGSWFTAMVVADDGDAPSWELKGDLAVARTIPGATTFSDTLTISGAVAGWESRKFLDADVAAVTSSTPAAVSTSLDFAVVSGVAYQVEYDLVVSVSNTATAGVLQVNGPAVTWTGSFIATWPVGVLGVDHLSHSRTAGFGTSVSFTNGTSAISTSYHATIKGTFKPSANGTVSILLGSQDNTNAITVKAGSIGVLRKLV
jgi:hypothetical protein